MKGSPTLALLIFLTACSSTNIDNKEAVKEGVLAHLKTRTDIDLSQMTVDVTSVSFRKGEADATVAFRAAGTDDPGAAMTLTYTMEQKDGKWVVKGRRSGSDDPHGQPQSGQLPPGHPPTGTEPQGKKP